MDVKIWDVRVRIMVMGGLRLAKMMGKEFKLLGFRCPCN